MTINELLVTMKAVRSRLSDLEHLRNQVSTRTRWHATTEREDEPQYDVKKVDKKIVELQAFLHKADVGIKKANAITEVQGVEVDMDLLLAPLE